MKKGSTMILRIAVFFAGAAVLALCCTVAFIIISEWGDVYEYPSLRYIIPIGVYSCSVPFFIALYQTLKLLKYIDNGCAFSELSVKSLTIIMRCAMVVFFICAIGGLPCFYFLADIDDAPGLMLIGMILCGASFIIAVFASVLRRLLYDAIGLKSENDLTI